MRRFDATGLAAVIATVAGLAALYLGLTDAAAPVFFGTEEERENAESGRQTMWIAMIVLALAPVLLVSRGRVMRALLVASTGVASLALVYAFPEALFAWLAYLPLALAALVAAAAAARSTSV